MSEDRTPIACTLTTKQAASQLDEWGELRSKASAVEEVDGGYRVTLPASADAVARDLAAREAQCCAFLTLDVTSSDDSVVVTVTGPAEAMPVIALIVGV